ncbi:MAG: DUF2057 family protein [Moraxellaceae bacterium]|nr:DUF2057 family protein [Moraxellaceae bacterium]
MRLWWWFATVLSAMALSACSTPGSVQMYDGPARPAQELVHISFPEQVQVLAVDGREPGNLLLQRQQGLDLLPGEHVLSVRYVELFRMGSDDHEIVRSRPAALRFTAQAGSRFRIEPSPRPANLDSAKRFGKEPAFSLIEEASGAVTPSTSIKSYAEASLIDTISKAFDGGTAPAATTHLDLLKDVWGRATPEERAGFRIWLDEQGK